MEFVSLVCCVVKNDSRFLIVQRSENERRAGLWEFPLGRVEKNESLLGAAKRELEEETGIKPTSISFRGVNKRVEGETYKLIFGFLVEPASVNVRLSEEHQDYKWVTAKEIVKTKNIGTDTRFFIKLVRN